VRHRGGFSLLDMKRFLRDIGFEGTGYSGLTWDDLPAYAPAVIPIKLRGYDHFVVLRGITGVGAIIADPGFGNYTVGRSDFLQAWASGVAFVVKPEDSRAHEKNAESRRGIRAVGDAGRRLGTDRSGAAAGAQ
jgi:predicted double-glycine peptidase